MDLAMQDHTGSTVDNAIAMQKYGVGQPVRRKEDDTLVRGKGKYTDDFNLPGQLHAWIAAFKSSSGHPSARARSSPTVGNDNLDQSFAFLRAICQNADLI